MKGGCNKRQRDARDACRVTREAREWPPDPAVHARRIAPAIEGSWDARLVSSRHAAADDDDAAAADEDASPDARFDASSQRILTSDADSSDPLEEHGTPGAASDAGTSASCLPVDPGSRGREAQTRAAETAVLASGSDRLSPRSEDRGTSTEAASDVTLTLDLLMSDGRREEESPDDLKAKEASWEERLRSREQGIVTTREVSSAKETETRGSGIESPSSD